MDNDMNKMGIEETKEEQKKPGKKPEANSPEEAVIQLSRGKIGLAVPILADDKEVKELTYDFRALTGMELADAMDKGAAGGGGNAFRITNRQALEVFAAAAAKETEGVDAGDIKRGLSSQDAIKAVQLATVFFVASSQAANGRIMKA